MAVVVLGVGASMGAGALWAVAYVPFITALICLAGFLSPTGRAILVPGQVTVADGVLCLEAAQPTQALGAERIQLTDIVQGFWQAPSRVHLVTRSGESVVMSLPRDDGERLLQAAGVAVSERVLRVPLANLASSVPTLAGLAVAVGFLGFSALILVLFMSRAFHTVVGSHGPMGSAIQAGVILSGVVTLAYALLRRREAVVGTDGVRYRRLFRARFIPYTSVARAVSYAAGVELQRRNGSVVRLRTFAAGDFDSEPRRAVLLDRIQQAMTAGGAVARVSLERLDRANRPFPAWRAELGKLLSGTAGYRSIPLSAADLATVIEDPAAPAARRIAAVVALGAAQPEEARRRVRIVIPACADEALARALERAAEGEIDEAVVEREEREMRR